jgi:hypothetical protein
MSYNGSGTFVINTSGQPVVSGTVITTTAFNALTADLATGLTTALTKDGQTTPTANIKLGGFKLTGVGAGTASTDGANVGQIQSGAGQYVAVTGTDTILGTLTPTLTAYVTGAVYVFRAAGANTGATTLNIDGLGAKSVTKNGTTALIAGDIASANMIEVSYDGTQFQLLGSVPSGSANQVGYFNGSARFSTSSSLTFNGTTVTTPTLDATTSVITRGPIGVGVTPTYGTSGQVLTSAGSGAAPTWATATSGAMVFISTKTASASASLEWTGLSGYDKYLLVFENVVGATQPTLSIQVGTGAGPTYITSGYAHSAIYWEYASPSTIGGAASSSDSSIYFYNGGSTSLTGASGQLLLTNFTNLVGTRMSVLGNLVTQQDSSSAWYYTAYGSGGVTNASSRTAIKLFMTFGGNIASGSASLYGITS